MNREQAAFLLGGTVFGLVAGLLMGFAMFKPGVFGVPPAAPSSSPSEAGMAADPHAEAPAPSTGGMDPGGTATMGKVMAELQRLKDAVEKNPNDVHSLVQLGDLYAEAGKFDQSRQYYVKALELNPHDADVMTSLGLCLLNLQDAHGALDLFRKASQQAPDSWTPYAYTVVAAVQLGDASVAEQALIRLKALNPSFEHLREFEARVAQMKGASAPAGS